MYTYGCFSYHFYCLFCFGISVVCFRSVCSFFLTAIHGGSLNKGSYFLFFSQLAAVLPVETIRASGEQFSVLDVIEGVFSALIKNFGVYFVYAHDEKIS